MCVCVCVVGGRVRVSMTLPLGNVCVWWMVESVWWVVDSVCVCVCVCVCVRGWVTCKSTCMYIRSTTIIY